MKNTPRGRSVGGQVTSSGLWIRTRKPRASRCLPVNLKISLSSVSRPGECADSRKIPQQYASLTRHPLYASRRWLGFGQRLRQGYVLRTVDVHNSIDDLTEEWGLHHEPLKIIPQPSQTGRRIGGARTLGQHIEPRRH